MHSFSQDTIIVHKDARLDELVAKQAFINQYTSHLTSSGLYKGYRLQLLVTQSRDEAFKMKATLLQNFPDQKSYVIYQSPNFKVRLGNFVSKDDAEKYKESIAQQFSSGVYVVEDGIEYNPSNTNANPEN